jgi:hypothetical protein
MIKKMFMRKHFSKRPFTIFVKPLNVITLMLRESNNINRMIKIISKLLMVQSNLKKIIRDLVNLITLTK